MVMRGSGGCGGGGTGAGTVASHVTKCTDGPSVPPPGRQGSSTGGQLAGIFAAWKARIGLYASIHAGRVISPWNHTRADSRANV